jgi:hypothetical protein
MIAFFSDMGKVTYPYKLNQAEIPSSYSFLFTDTDDSFHYSYGTGGYLVINSNVAVHGFIAVPGLKDDGEYGVYLGMGFLF